MSKKGCEDVLSEVKEKELKNYAQDIRIQTVSMISRVGSGHVGGSLSIADLMASLYGGLMKFDPKNPKWDDRDRIVMSKGHAGPAMYAALAMKGFFPMEWLDTLNQPPTNLPSHTDMNRTPGVDMTTGSLGQGASTAAGIALAGKLSGKTYYTFLLLGDGECEEGQVWEAAEFAGVNGLERLVAFVDSNGKQLDGIVEEIAGKPNFEEKFIAFGWNALTVENGNEVRQIWNAVEKAKSIQNGRPTCIVLNTVKGKGWKEAERAESCHSFAVPREKLADVVAEMEAGKV